MTKLCPNCSTMNLPEAAFCANCSARLAPGAATGTRPNQQQQWAPQGGPVANYGSPAAAAGASQRAIVALVLGIVAFFCCGLVAGVPAAIVGWMELQAINSGQSSPDGKWMAQVGLWVGIAASIIHVVGWVLYLLLVILSSAR